MNIKHKRVIEDLTAGRAVSDYKEGGNSMRPLIKHREPVRLEPVDTSKLEKGDMVFVKVKGKIYTHKVLALKDDKVMIGNNHGGVNGWTKLTNVYGIVTMVGDRVVGGASKKVKQIIVKNIIVLNEVETIRLRAPMYGLTEEKARGMTDNELADYLISLFKGSDGGATFDFVQKRMRELDGKEMY